MGFSQLALAGLTDWMLRGLRWGLLGRSHSACCYMRHAVCLYLTDLSAIVIIMRVQRSVEVMGGWVALSVSQAFVIAFAAWLLWEVARGVYNVYFHPLSRFPGPAAAKITQWWTTYVEIYKRQSMVEVLVELHKVYGSFTHSVLHYAIMLIETILR
jgi:hypothetical protein